MELFLYFIAMIGGSIQYEPKFVFWVAVSMVVVSLGAVVLLERLFMRKKEEAGRG